MSNPWHGTAERYPDGTVVKGVVSKTMDFGAFIRLEPGLEGLIHISELAHGRVPSVRAVVNVGDEVEVKVLSVDIKKRRIALSRKATMEPPVDEVKDKAKQDADEKVRELAVKPTKQTLKGGRDKGSGGEQFGLKW